MKRAWLLFLLLAACADNGPSDGAVDAAVADAANADAANADAANADAANADAMSADATNADAMNADAMNADATSADAQSPADGGTPSPRMLHATTLLDDGRVLVTGGLFRPDESTQEESWIFDPAGDTWTPGQAMVPGRGGHAATRLADGRVLITGGARFEGVAQREERGRASIFDPTSGALTQTGTMAAARLYHTAVLLVTGPDSGKVLVAGGIAALTGVRTLELYDPATGEFEALAQPVLPEPLVGSSIVRLADGNVLISGGTLANGTLTTAAWVYGATMRTLELTQGAMATPRRGHVSTLLADGRVLASGGRDGSNNRLAGAELYDPASGMFSPAGNMMTARESHAQALLPGGAVWVTGGSSGMVLDTIEVFDGSTFMAHATRLTVPAAAHTATALLDGRILIVGGQSRMGMLLLDYQLLSP